MHEQLFSFRVPREAFTQIQDTEANQDSSQGWCSPPPARTDQPKLGASVVASRAPFLSSPCQNLSWTELFICGKSWELCKRTQDTGRLPELLLQHRRENCSPAQTHRTEQDAGGAVLQEAALTHTRHLHSDELFSRHPKDPGLRITHDLEISSFMPPPTSSLRGSGRRQAQPRRCFEVRNLPEGGEKGMPELGIEEQEGHSPICPYLSHAGSSVKRN